MLVVGVDYVIDDRWGVFVEIKKFWLEIEIDFIVFIGVGLVVGGLKLMFDLVMVMLGVLYWF